MSTSTYVASPSKVYTSINDLPENAAIVDGDRFIVQSSDGETALLDYSAMKINLDHTTFGTQFTEMVQFTSTVQQWVNQLTTEFNTIEEEFSEIKEEVKTVNQAIEAFKVIFKLIMGQRNAYSEEATREWIENRLDAYQLVIFDEVMKDNDPSFTFATNNLLRVY